MSVASPEAQFALPCQVDGMDDFLVPEAERERERNSLKISLTVVPLWTTSRLKQYNCKWEL